MNQFKSKDKHLINNFFIVDIATLLFENIEKIFNKIKTKSFTTTQFKTKIFEKFHDFINRWNFIKINKMSSHREWNHRIDLKSKSTLFSKKLYELFKKQSQMIKKYINDMLNKEFIQFNHSNYVVSIFIIKKFEKELRICVDYKVFNVLIIKNKNKNFIRDILTKLCNVKIYSKFDIIVVFNEIKIRLKNEKKTMFFIRYDLYEYVIMFFELCNVSKKFQTFINYIFREYLNNFCFKYLNDILIFNNIKKNTYNTFAICLNVSKKSIFFWTSTNANFSWFQLNI